MASSMLELKAEVMSVRAALCIIVKLLAWAYTPQDNVVSVVDTTVGILLAKNVAETDSKLMYNINAHIKI